MRLIHHRSVQTGSTRSAAVSPSGRLVAVGDDFGRLRVWELPLLRCVADCQTSTAEYAHIYGLAFTPDDQRLVLTRAVAYQLLLWEPTLSAVPTVLAEGPADDDEDAHRAWDGFQPYTVQIDPAGQRLFCGDNNGRLRCWDLPTRQRQWERAAHAYGMIQLAGSPDGTQLATSGYHGTLGRWHTTDGSGSQVATPELDDCRGVAWSPDGHDLISVGFGQADRPPTAQGWPVLQRWDPTTLTLRASYPWPCRWGESVAWHPHAPLLAMGDSAGTIVLWETTTWIPCHTIRARTHTVTTLAWTPNGDFLVSAGYGRTDGRDRLVVWRWSGS